MRGTALEPEAFREFFGSIPTATAVVTAEGPDGRPVGFTCSAFCAVSLDPALLLVCVDERSRTLPSVLASDAFALHLLSAEGGEELARTFAGRSDRKFDGVPWRHGEYVPACPVLQDGVLGHVECAVERTIAAGDHQLLIGRMVGVRMRDAVRPLLYQRGTFAAWDVIPAEIAARA